MKRNRRTLKEDISLHVEMILLTSARILRLLVMSFKTLNRRKVRSTLKDDELCS